jgi:TPR repeat protein
VQGIGVAQNKRRAFELYVAAAESGLSEAQYNAGLCYYEAVGTGHDDQRAVYWFERACAQNYPSAQCKCSE